jgi:hypothetical protein
MMDRKKGAGNALFDYILYARKIYHSKMEMGMSHFATLRAAILFELKESPVKWEGYTYTGEYHLTSFWSGLNKENNAWVTKHGIDDDAKVAVPYQIYEEVAKAFLRQGNLKEWAYLVLQWNLMARKCNVADIHFNFIRWQGDMMTILFCHTKTQGGKREEAKKFHLSSNPESPWVCPVTAVALLLMDSSHDGKSLFESTAAAAAYTRAFDQALDDPFVVEAMRIAGVRKEDVASHSIRKSAASYASGGTTAPPAIFSILLRAGWSLGDVLTRYIKVAEAQDRFLAHILVGRDVFNKSFTILPPHFVRSPSDDVLKSAFVGAWMDTQFENLKGVLHLLLASAVSGIALLKTEIRLVTKEVSGVTKQVREAIPLIPSSHHIFSNVALHGSVHTDLSSMLAQGEARYSSNIMKCTGVPPWSYLQIDVNKLTEQQKDVVKILKELRDAAQNGGKKMFYKNLIRCYFSKKNYVF